MKIVTNMNTLRAMQRNNFVKFCSDTGRKIQGLYSSKSFVCYYVDEALSRFTYKGKLYGQKYISGCFYPYVVELS
jgi:hypothetical protein